MHSPTTSLLERYFATVKTLRTYLSEILQPLAQGDINSQTFTFYPRDNDSSSYIDLLNTSYVALKKIDEPEAQGDRLQAFPTTVDMREIIDKAQEKLFKMKGPQNMITAGYRLAFKDGDRGKQGMTRVGITNHFVNTIITALQASEWETLLQRIGVDAMLRLLTETYVFVSLPNGCLCQIAGEPMIHMVPAIRHMPEPPLGMHTVSKRPFLYPNDHADERPTKRLKFSTPSKSTVITTPKILQRSPADISFIRTKVLYSRPCSVPHTNRVIVGLPATHILNRVNPSYQREPKIGPEAFTDPDPKEQAKDARHVAKYVFPRQYGLSSPFKAIYVKKEAFELPDYSDRELEIKAIGASKTPKRLKDVLLLLEKMIWRHGKCGYKPLRDKVCPSKLVTEGSKVIDSSIILDLMSEYPSQLRSQMPMSTANTSLNSSGNPTTPYGLTQAEQHVKAKPRFAEFACSTLEVYRYVALITKTVIPKAFWGCDRNFRLILQYVKEFIACRRWESLTLHHVLQGFSTSECEWLMPPGKAARRQNRVSVSDALKRREMLEEFLFWYFDSFVSSLLKTNFYITESSAFRNRVLYFRQDDWETLCAPLIERLKTGTFEKMTESEAKEVLRQRKLGFSFIRLLPKDTGVRPIVNLRRRKPTYKGGKSSEQSINQILQAAFHILTYEKQKHPHLLGVSVFGPDQVYPKLKGFKSRFLRNSGNLPKLYFVKVDVQACFDTIEQTKLLEILRELISEDIYMTQRYGQLKMAAGRIKRTYVKKAIPEDEHPHFLRYAADLAGALRNTIFVDQVIYPYSKKLEILQLLEEHITENIVKIGNDYFRQIVGIPQGSVLSTLLCSFFYGDLEKRFGQFTEDLQSVLLRLIDDYLFITTDISKAKAFLDVMNQGHPEYGCFISKEKTLTNFDHGCEILNVTEPKQRCFPWCGYMINMEDLSVSVDYTRYIGTDLYNTLTVERGRRPGAAFVHKMLYSARAKTHLVYSDVELNTEHGVYLNVYQNFLLSAMKMHKYLRDWGLGANGNAAFLHKTVQKAIHYSYVVMRNTAVDKICCVQKMAVIWLGTHAFHTVLSRKGRRYAVLLRALALELSRRRHRRYRSRFRRLIEEGEAGLSQIKF